MRLKVKSWNQLLKEGLRLKGNYIVKPDGNKVYRRAIRYCDKTVRVFCKHKNKVEISGEWNNLIPIEFFTKEQLQRIPSSKSFEIGSRKFYLIPGKEFNFPCGFSTMTIKQARKVAKIILKVGRQS